VVARDVPDFALMAGVPARQIGWISRFGERLALPLAGNGEARCPHTGDATCSSTAPARWPRDQPQP
jgi:UDP-2-acetamido-3-amino-2,3-dideoxy-glucuronate N-acetyltransferase